MKIQEKERSFEKQLEDKILEKYEDIKLQIRLRNLEKFISTLISSLMKFLNDKRTLSVGSLTLLLLMVKALIDVNVAKFSVIWGFFWKTKLLQFSRLENLACKNDFLGIELLMFIVQIGLMLHAHLKYKCKKIGSVMNDLRYKPKCSDFSFKLYYCRYGLNPISIYIQICSFKYTVI